MERRTPPVILGRMISTFANQELSIALFSSTQSAISQQRLFLALRSRDSGCSFHHSLDLQTLREGRQENFGLCPFYRLHTF
jgi:hypothetical protein